MIEFYLFAITRCVVDKSSEEVMIRDILFS